MKAAPILLPLALVAACSGPGTAAGEPRPPDPGGSPPDCPLQVVFASYGAGTDRPTVDAVGALLAEDRAVREVERYPWGREGELTLCARVASEADAERLFHRIKDLFPADPRGPLDVSTDGGLRFHAPQTNELPG